MDKGYIVIRKAEQKDIENLCVLKQQVWISTYATEGLRSDFSKYVLQEYTLENEEKILSDPAKYTLIAEEDGHLIGCSQISLSPQKAMDKIEEGLEIEVLYVLERFQSKGIGKKLLDASLDFIKEQKANNAWLTVYHKNQNAIDFYIRNKLEHIGNTDFVLFDDKYKNLIMLKKWI